MSFCNTINCDFVPPQMWKRSCLINADLILAHVSLFTFLPLSNHWQPKKGLDTRRTFPKYSHNYFSCQCNNIKTSWHYTTNR